MSDSNPSYDAARDAVDRKLVPHALTRLWAADPDSVSTVGDGANIVYRFTCGGRTHFLKLFHLEQTPQIRVESAVDYLRTLAERGAPVCAPVASISGALVELPRDLSGFAATVVAGVPGAPIGLNHREPAVYEAWGRSLGEIHAAGCHYAPNEARQFTTADGIWLDVERRIPEDDPIVREEFERVDAWRESLPRDPDMFGLTHADFREGNIFWDGATAWAIDFDEPVYDWWAADIARPFIEFAERGIEGRRDFLAAFVRGYRSVRDLSEAWVEDLPWFMRCKNLDRYTWVNTCWAGDPVPGGERRDVFLRQTREGFANPQRW